MTEITYVMIIFYLCSEPHTYTLSNKMRPIHNITYGKPCSIKKKHNNVHNHVPKTPASEYKENCFIHGLIHRKPQEVIYKSCTEELICHSLLNIRTRRNSKCLIVVFLNLII